MATLEKVRTNVYLNKSAKDNAIKVLKKYGLNLSGAFNLFLSIISETKTLPFEFRIPNKTTQKAINDTLEGRELEEVTVEELLNEIEEAQAVSQGSEKGENH